MTAPAPLLEVTGLGRRFERRGDRGEALDVLADLSFAIREGELVTVLGPSGSGKSTLLNILAQLDRPTAGTVKLRGETISAPGQEQLEPGFRCNIGYVTQQDNLLPWRRLEENILFPLVAQNRLDAAGRKRAAELIEATGLKGFERFYPHELSGGMRKRAALARTLVYDPPVILMDEPFGALDAQTRQKLHENLLELWSTRKKTILFVTHDIAEAIILGDRVLVLCKSPARVIDEQIIDLKRPRRQDELLGDPAFAKAHDALRRHFT